tara:strand:- start:784 stop:1134 length:351 start_codon:yes stop_codon:yes gene_type:complete
MAVTVTQNGRTNVSGNRLTVSLSLTDDDTSYNAGGIVFDANQYVGNPDMVHIESVSPGYLFSYDRANKKIQAFAQRDDANAHGEPDSGTAPIPLTEVVGEDLSAITLRIMITGTRA